MMYISNTRIKFDPLNISFGTVSNNALLLITSLFFMSFCLVMQYYSNFEYWPELSSAYFASLSEKK